MKLFCRNEEKVIRVKITNDSLPLKILNSQPSPPATNPESKKLQYESAVKIVGLVVVFFHGLLAIMGYVDFTGRLETLGISTNEIDLGLPTLLFQGYLAVVIAGVNGAADWYPWGAIALALIPSMLFFLFTGKLIKFQTWFDKLIFSLLLTLGLVLISIIPTFGLMRGEQSAYETLHKHAALGENQKVVGLKKVMTIRTKENTVVVGETMFASTLYTYVLQDRTMYKIANRDNHIVSTTVMDPVARPESKVKAELPQAPKAELQSTGHNPDKPSTQSTLDPRHR